MMDAIMGLPWKAIVGWSVLAFFLFCVGALIWEWRQSKRRKAEKRENYYRLHDVGVQWVEDNLIGRDVRMRLRNRCDIAGRPIAVRGRVLKFKSYDTTERGPYEEQVSFFGRLYDEFRFANMGQDIEDGRDPSANGAYWLTDIEVLVDLDEFDSPFWVDFVQGIPPHENGEVFTFGTGGDRNDPNEVDAVSIEDGRRAQIEDA